MSNVAIIANKLQKLIYSQISMLDIRKENIDAPQETLDEIVDSLTEIITESFTRELRQKDIKALDAFEKEFIIPKNSAILNDDVDELIDLKIKNPNIPLENLYLITPKRFSVIYDSSGRITITNIPSDVFKFLIKNNYDMIIIESLNKKYFSIRYNIVEAYKKILKSGIGFETKVKMMNDNATKDDTNIIYYIKHKLNPIGANKLDNQYNDYKGYNIYRYTLNRCRELNICSLEVMNRVINHNMTLDDAIAIGIEEKEKYGIDNTITEDSICSKKLVEVFYEVAREYMKERENKQ